MGINDPLASVSRVAGTIGTPLCLAVFFEELQQPFHGLISHPTKDAHQYVLCMLLIKEKEAKKLCVQLGD